jgi:hypothetical protein
MGSFRRYKYIVDYDPHPNLSQSVRMGLRSPHLKPDCFLWQICPSFLCQMFTDSTNMGVDSTDHEHCMQSELDPLIQRDEKGPTAKEKRVARAQFLALCWALFVVGWTDGSTGPLLPRIQTFYNVSYPTGYSFGRSFLTHGFCRWASEQCPGFLFCNVQ